MKKVKNLNIRDYTGYDMVVKDETGRVKEPCYSCGYLTINEQTRKYLCRKSSCKKAFECSV